MAAEQFKKPRSLTLKEVMDIMAEDEGLDPRTREKAAEMSATLPHKSDTIEHDSE